MNTIYITFARSVYETSELTGYFEDMHLLSSEPFAKDTEISIFFEDISASGLLILKFLLIVQNTYAPTCTCTLSLISHSLM